jgi:hypothetical protein
MKINAPILQAIRHHRYNKPIVIGPYRTDNMFWTNWGCIIINSNVTKILALESMLQIALSIEHCDFAKIEVVDNNVCITIEILWWTDVE